MSSALKRPADASASQDPAAATKHARPADGAASTAAQPVSGLVEDVAEAVGDASGSAPGSHPESILGFLATLKGPELTSLYRDPFTVMTVFRSLPAVARQLILRFLLLVNVALPRSEVMRVLGSDVTRPLGGPALRKRLTDLSILLSKSTVPLAGAFSAGKPEAKEGAKEMYVVLNPEFQRCLINALCAVPFDATAKQSQQQPAQQQQPALTLSFVSSGAGAPAPAAEAPIATAAPAPESSSEPRGRPQSVAALDAHAAATWSRFLLWVVGVGDAHQAPPPSVRRLAQEMGLVAPAGRRSDPAAAAELQARLGGLAAQLSGRELVVTPEGVAFLFKPRVHQVWSVVLYYMDALQRASAGGVAVSRDEMLRLLFRLCFLTLGAEYSVNELTSGQRRMLRDLRSLGLVYQDTEASSTFWPTRLAVLLSGPSASGSGAGGANTGAAIRAAAAAALAEGGSATAAAAREAAAAVLATLSDASSAAALTASVSASAPGGGSGDEESEGFIIVETSFKVVAFTRSPLRLALLSIFVDLSFLLPNAAVGRITRASVRRALVNKLEVSDIVAWFARHAHRQVLRRAVGVPDETGRLTGGNGVIVPDNVVKQMGLWADERSRLSGRNAALITEFKDAEEFADWAAFCKRADVLLLQDTATRSLVVSLEGLQVVRDEHARRAALANGVAAPAAAPNQ